MSGELISKKDLLDLTGISYGQLYRWKRKNLIPEEWFIRKSTFTGQETFFPKEKIFDRIEKIQAMKENLSLDELAGMFSPSVSELQLSQKELIERNIVSETALDFFLENFPQTEELSFEKILHVYILEKLLQSGDINLSEGKLLLQVLMDYYQQVKQKNSMVLFIRKLGVSSCLLVSNTDGLFFDHGTKVVVKMSIMDCMEELKTKLL
ncbi:YhbD family protein [Bacillus sp. 03113]|uniref:YhbD family protein n=1 Tax=Bacillus sp. 03113 TaxID=2578211 RepID=UPI001144B6C8|nr:YhbD family protein [Bacillus sp. 03113]